MPHLPETAYFPLAPDWVCEILSPSTAVVDRVKKLAIYAREGVAHAWLVDPVLQTLEVLRLEAGRWVLLAGDAGMQASRRAGGRARRLDPALPGAFSLS
jgi:Uma2 family endonuclease